MEIYYCKTGYENGSQYGSFVVNTMEDCYDKLNDLVASCKFEDFQYISIEHIITKQETGGLEIVIREGELIDKLEKYITNRTEYQKVENRISTVSRYKKESECWLRCVDEQIKNHNKAIEQCTFQLKELNSELKQYAKELETIKGE